MTFRSVFFNMLQASFSSAEEDKHARALREVLVEAQQLLDAIEAALAQDGDELLSTAERAAIESSMGNLRKLMNGTDSQAIHKAAEALNHTTETFAARRMDASVKRALSGKKLNSLEI